MKIFYYLTGGTDCSYLFSGKFRSKKAFQEWKERNEWKYAIFTQKETPELTWRILEYTFKTQEQLKKIKKV
jgi:hypothetical protein